MCHFVVHLIRWTWGQTWCYINSVILPTGWYCYSSTVANIWLRSHSNMLDQISPVHACLICLLYRQMNEIAGWFIRRRGANGNLLAIKTSGMSKSYQRRGIWVCCPRGHGTLMWPWPQGTRLLWLLSNSALGSIGSPESQRNKAQNYLHWNYNPSFCTCTSEPSCLSLFYTDE